MRGARRPALHIPIRRMTREHRALMALVRVTPPPSLAGIPAGLDWDALAGHAVGHNLAPLLYAHMRELPTKNGGKVVSTIPETVLPRLERDYWFSLALAGAQQAAVAQIASALEQSGIEWIALKGLLFGRTLYRTPEARPMGDLDFLVRGADMDAACAVLETQGFERTIHPSRRITHEEMFERHYVRGDGPFRVKVEPHTGLGQADRYRVDVDGLWERSVPVSRYGVTDWGTCARALSPEDALAHLFLHQANAVFDEHDLRGVLDVHEIVVQWNPDWDVVLERARAWRVVIPMFVALTAARALLATPVPPRILDAVRPGPLRRRWLRLFLDLDGLGLYRYAAHPRWMKRVFVGFPSMDRPLDALRYAGSYAALRLRDRRASRGAVE